MYRRRLLIAPALALFAAASMAWTTAKAGEVYAGKTINLIIGYGFGGTYGSYARLFADHIKRHIPGNPNVIVISKPGAGGLLAVNYAYNVMPADGFNIFMPTDSLVVAQLLRPKKIKYDARKFAYLGATNQTNTIMVVRTDSGISSIEDLKNKPLVIGGTGPGSTSTMLPNALKNMLGLAKMKIITGYKGSSKTILAVEQGEIQAASFNWLAWSSKVPQWFKNGFARPILQLGVWKDPDLPNVPMLSDLVSAKHKPIIAFMATHGIIGRGLATPPGVSGDKIAILKAAFAKMVADPVYIAMAKKRRLRVIPSTGEQIQKVVNDAFANADKDVIALARKLILGK